MLFGILLLIIALPTKESSKEDTAEPVTEEEPVTEDVSYEEMEKRLEEALKRVEGVGEVTVILTYEDTGQKNVEKDETETVFTEDSQGNQVPFVASETLPTVRGVLVIAQGGENPIVVQNIREAVMALFQVEAHKIKVMKMK